MASLASTAEQKTILVTGGNRGIGYALVTQLLLPPHNAHVFLAAKHFNDAHSAASTILKNHPNVAVTPCEVNISEDNSVHALREGFLSQSIKLDVLVNNAGVGLRGEATNEILNTNLYGCKRMCDMVLSSSHAFGNEQEVGPILKEDGGRIVNVGSGIGACYVDHGEYMGQKLGKVPAKDRTILENWSVTWEQIQNLCRLEDNLHGGVGNMNQSYYGANMGHSAYGLSKACIAAFTMILARSHPTIVVSCCSPGFVDTHMTEGMGATKPASEGTLSIKKCIFEDLGGSGYYFGSDGLRSPLKGMRTPGEPEYDGSEDRGSLAAAIATHTNTRARAQEAAAPIGKLSLDEMKQASGYF